MSNNNFSNTTIRTAMQTASKAMSRINAAIDPQRLQAMMKQFAQQSDRMNVTEEMMDDMMGRKSRHSFVFRKFVTRQ